MSTTLERTIQAEQEAHEAAQADDDQEDHVDEKGRPTLIDRSAYEREDLAINKVDGQAIDRIAITFNGTVYLDRSDPADVHLYNRLVLQRDVTLMVEGKCSGGDLDVIIGEKRVKVTTVYIPAIAESSEELEGAA